MEIVLLGKRHGERAENFEKAALLLGARVQVKDLSNIANINFKDAVVKIDPPRLGSAVIGELPRLTSLFENQLRELDKITYGTNTYFLNSPKSILETLDKNLCKSRLQSAGISHTPALRGNIIDTDSLILAMNKTEWNKVFIKPNQGGGASGIMAYKRDPKTGKESLYTSARLMTGKLFNTKHLLRFRQPAQTRALIDTLCKKPIIIEQWLPKAQYEGFNYDLRAVFQFGRLVYLIPRLSRGPVTNLHLNNRSRFWHELGHPPELFCEIENLCRQAVALFSGLNSVGIDILLHKDNLKPYIIEMNAQGDLLHQDIRGNNIIYKDQIKGMLQL